ncbi:MAG: hypothetical protein M1480_11500 [Bacteroidetes bacterium]|nr:hypothetical protein [Bacteroidota bacterium]
MKQVKGKSNLIKFLGELRKEAFIISLFFFCSCEENPVAPNASLNSDFNIKYDQSVYITEENLLITFEDVIEESRCPLGLKCYWEGTAKIKLLIRQGNEVRVDTVQTYLPQSIISIGEINNSYLFWVKKVEPYPKRNMLIEKRNYILTLNISHFTYGFSDSEIEYKTGIFGQVYITGGPALRTGYIDERPFQTTFKIVNNQNDSTTVQTDSTGKFIAYLQPGQYHVAPNKGFPILISTETYNVNDGKMNYLNIFYDSGMR